MAASRGTTDEQRIGKYRLKACPVCAGAAAIRRADDLRHYYGLCADCGLRTRDCVSARAAQWAWNRRRTERARVLTTSELCESDYALWDDRGVMACWIETRADGGLTAAIISAGWDLGECALDIMDVFGVWHAVSRDMLREYGKTWRVWNWKPGAAEIEGESWDRPLYGEMEFANYGRDDDECDGE